MDRDNTVKRQINPRAKANCFSLISFFYTLKMYIKGYTKGFELDDIYEVLPDCQAENEYKKIEHHWFRQTPSKKKPSICRLLWFRYGKTYLFLGVIQFTSTMIMTVWSPKAQSKLISYFDPVQTKLTKDDAIFYAIIVVGINLVNAIVSHNVRVILVKLSIKAKTAVSTLLYRKSLKLSSKSLSNVTTGKIVTIVTKDIDSLEQVSAFGNTMWISIIQTFLICFLIYQKIGLASIYGVTFFFIVLPLQIFIGKLTYNYKLRCSRKTDERLDVIREIVSYIRIIKMYCWEQFFEEKVSDLRKKEIKQLHKLFYTTVWIIAISSISSKCAFFIFLLTYVYKETNVTAETVFYILSCFNDLETSLGNDIPFGAAAFAQFFAMNKRIDSVLIAEEVPLKQKLQQHYEPQVTFNNVTVYNNLTVILKNISLEIKKGLHVVIGPIGCGKTTLLKTILEECPKTGEMEILGTISYASQEPWVFPSTIKNNILFGEQYDKKRYDKVLELCNLKHDLMQFTEGDYAFVGENGKNFSKGQRARINLARAIYKESDIYLLDDCLSSLDAHVADAIFKDCILEFLKNKLTIYVTNNGDQIKSADSIMRINLTNVECCKNKDLIFNHVTSSQIEEEQNPIEEEPIHKPLYYENKKSGLVPLKHYYSYIKQGGGFIIFTIIVSVFVLAQFAVNSTEKLLSKWITLEQNLTNLKELYQANTTEYNLMYQENIRNLNYYIVIAVLSILLTMMKFFFYFYFVRKASINIHKLMVHTLLNATLKFYDKHILGNIITRFTKDCVTIDEVLPFSSIACFWMIFSVFGGIVLLTTVNFLFLIESFTFIVVAIIVKQFCQPTGRNLERLHVMGLKTNLKQFPRVILSRSPINGHFNSTLDGLTTIRASNAEIILTKEFDKHQNLYSSATFLLGTSFIALSIFLKYICIMFLTSIITHFLIQDSGSNVGDAGLVITQSFVITNTVMYGIIYIADVENLMISVERVLEYTELEQERTDGTIVLGWPKSGSIKFEHISLNYDSEQFMLDDVNFAINPKEKICIAGRTGAGKSSIISSLFRLYQTKGKIFIDDIDINTVSLKWLRSNLSVVSQDPYLFPGTIRENLDPLKLHLDDQIWRVLKELKLDALINNLDDCINHASSYSAGEKQLLCLARVILKQNKIVILDEVTANVDEETEKRIHKSIDSHFKNCTLIVISHKILAVRSCQKVLVLRDGKVSEFGSFEELVKNNSSFLNKVTE